MKHCKKHKISYEETMIICPKCLDELHEKEFAAMPCPKCGHYYQGCECYKCGYKDCD